jgi:hypothetical protein
MKITLALISIAGIFCLPSCTQSYTCGRQCYIYNNNIKICQTGPADAAQFAKSVDSLTNLYGKGSPVFADSVSVDGYSNNAVNTITNQLENQGYTCNANN